MVLNDLHFYLLVSLILAVVILYKKLLVPFFASTDKEIEDIKNDIDSRSTRKHELQINHELLVKELDEENRNINLAIHKAHDIAKNIQVDAEKTIEAFAIQKEKIYQSNVLKITNMAYIDLYDAIVDSIMKGLRDELHFSENDHVSFNNNVLDRLCKVRIA